MTPKEFTEEYGELCEALSTFTMVMLAEPTLEARNFLFHRDRLLDCLEEWHKFHQRGTQIMNPIPPELRRRIVQVAAEIGAELSPTPSGESVKAAMEAFMVAMDAYTAECRAKGDL